MVAALVLVVATQVAGCADLQAQDLCTRFDSLEQQVDALRKLDPQTADPDDLRRQAQEVQQELDAVQAVTEGRLDTAISNLRTAAHDVAVTLTDATREVAETARPVVEDSVERLREAWAVVDQIAQNQCEQP